MRADSGSALAAAIWLGNSLPPCASKSSGRGNFRGRPLPRLIGHSPFGRYSDIDDARPSLYDPCAFTLVEWPCSPRSRKPSARCLAFGEGPPDTGRPPLPPPPPCCDGTLLTCATTPSTCMKLSFDSRMSLRSEFISPNVWRTTLVSRSRSAPSGAAGG